MYSCPGGELRPKWTNGMKFISGKGIQSMLSPFVSKGVAPQTVIGRSKNKMMQNNGLAQKFVIGRREVSDLWVRVVANLSNTGKDTKRLIAVGVDLVTVFAALMCAFVLRISTIDIEQLWPLYVFAPIATVLIFSGVGVYGMVIRYSRIEEMTPLLLGVVLSSVMVLVFLFMLSPNPNPRSIFVIYGLVLATFTLATRHVWRSAVSDHNTSAGVPIAIYGAGALGRQVMQICRNGVDYQPVFWLDDDPKQHNRLLANIPVLDPKDSAAPKILKANGIETILMAIPSVGTSRMKELLESLQAFNCTVKTLPSIDDIMANRVTSKDAKSLPLEEVIGRQPVKPIPELMSKNITGKVVMVTGAGGSVGSELCRQIMRLRPTALVLFDVSEAAMYLIEQDLKKLIANSAEITAPIHCVIGNVVFKNDVAHAITTYSVNTLFHAAAYKHVPMVESNPQPAVRTNILGSLATVEAAIENKVENFLLVSTDKAVRPTNIMGATKRVAEMIMQAKAAAASGDTCISMVRFGNVLSSSGSVVPKFSEQIEAGGPITVTDKNIVRYFMSIPEAAQLVIQASALAKGGDLFVLDMGKPVQIADLAKSLIYLHGKTIKDESNPKGDIEIRYTGLREGEKLFEELLIDENAIPTEHSKISRAREEYIGWNELYGFVLQFEQEMTTDPGSDMVESLKNVVAGYSPQRSGIGVGLATQLITEGESIEISNIV